ncbi:ABC transporter substrate-binding protein [Arcobacter arenosus]|jgi:NitT/TauT family transport system substrate-binding protein|uniref:ABC transporter substrate-binding protein n=1 Tax=Arcobacter arenosus TaxID=2576037 RepID=A0A5R8Y1I6_9BACT|nr:transporter substrate-binding domain-containing protein [Arcobacter arenosus]TLP38325.1 ABC transporter substrate-binding protein [Arcobacter arenosus]
MFKIIFLTICFLFTNLHALEKLKVGVLAFGTVNWELDVLKHNKLDIKNGFELEVVKLASKNATSIALQSGSVDIIVTDWVWVNTQRANGGDYTLYPYSKATGTLYLSKNNNAKTLLDLEGKNIGVAGGPVDKTWLILRAYSKLKYGKDFKDIINPTFAAPPILLKKVLDGSLDGALNFWHFNAKAKAKGARALIEMEEVFKSFGIVEDIPLIGWTFRRDLALMDPRLYDSFINASKSAKKILLKDDKEWDRIKPLMKVKDEATFNSLKEGYKNGVILKFDEKNIEDSKKIFKVLQEQGGKKLVKNSKELDPKTFWEINK